MSYSPSTHPKYTTQKQKKQIKTMFVAPIRRCGGSFFKTARNHAAMGVFPTSPAPANLQSYCKECPKAFFTYVVNETRRDFSSAREVPQQGESCVLHRPADVAAGQGVDIFCSIKDYKKWRNSLVGISLFQLSPRSCPLSCLSKKKKKTQNRYGWARAHNGSPAHWALDPSRSRSCPVRPCCCVYICQSFAICPARSNWILFCLLQPYTLSLPYSLSLLPYTYSLVLLFCGVTLNVFEFFLTSSLTSSVNICRTWTRTLVTWTGMLLHSPTLPDSKARKLWCLLLLPKICTHWTPGG